MWLYIIQGLAYGFAAAVQPGPFQTYLISQTLSKGWKRTLPTTLAPLISDGPIIALCLLVLSQVPVWLQRFLYIAGGSFIFYRAYGAYMAWKNFDSTISSTESATQQGVFRAALVNMLNPNPFDGLARDPHQWIGIYRWFLCVSRFQSDCHRCCIRHCKTVRAESEPRLAWGFCNRLILLWPVSIVAGNSPSIIKLICIVSLA